MSIVKTFTGKKGATGVIRRVHKDDLDEMLRYVNKLIQEDTYVLISGKPVTQEEEAKFLQNTLKEIQTKQTITLIVEVDGTFAGIASVRRDIYRKYHVGTPGISLAAEYRGQGIGKIVFETLIDEAKKIGIRLLVLHCFENNARGLALYESLGFKRIGVIPKAVLFKGNYIGEVDLYLPLVE